jgi:hypothetical protein
MRLKLWRDGRGQTIVEVLLGVSILGLVLVASYVASNRSLRAMQDAQERTEAMRHATSMVETIRFYSTLQPGEGTTINENTTMARLFPPPETSAGHIYCLDTMPAGVQERRPPVIAPNPPNPATDPKECRKGDDGRYFVTVRVDRLPPPDHDPWPTPRYEYTVRATWDGLFGADVDNVVEIKYRQARVVQ